MQRLIVLLCSVLAHGTLAAITDIYWLKPQGSALQHQDVRFRENAYWKFALNGPSVNDFSRPCAGPGPPITTITCRF